MMIDLPESEARQLLNQELSCIDSPTWMPIKVQPGTSQIEVGVIDSSGHSARLLVQLIYKRSPKTKRISYRFSVFKRQPYGLERVYQLAIEQWPTQIKDLHTKSHEHFGDRRTIGHQSWDNWTFEEEILYFCQKTNIKFSPPISHPENFELIGGKK
jgi:hypothetical protein